MYYNEKFDFVKFSSKIALFSEFFRIYVNTGYICYFVYMQKFPGKVPKK